MDLIYFVDKKGATLIVVESKLVPRAGEMVSIPESYFSPEFRDSHPKRFYRVENVEWPVVKGPNGTYLEVFVTLESE